ncbi:MAG TPA: hypothetical protein VFW33_19795 [Gemmataceae bacterium]|nr:hypothetical protein [Gemmataceae bacterium]
MLTTTAACLLALSIAADPAPRAGKYFKITVTDEQTGRGVPLVELRTVNGIRLWTDSNGVAAFFEPGLMGQSVFFQVGSHGYEFPKDGFGYRGRALKVTEGGEATLKIRRVNVAERLYRVTGGGIYADSLLVGEKVPIKRPALNGQVLGSDSVVSAVYKGRVYWFWGDTNRPSYPLGNFHVPGATSRLPGEGGLAPEVGVDLDYFLDDKGFAKETARLPGDGPTWLNSVVVLRDGKAERMFAGYVKVKPPLAVYARGLAEWDDDRKEFRKVAAFDLKTPLVPQGHAFLHTTGRVEYVYFANPYPLTRVKADPAALARPADYEGLTCLEQGSTAGEGRVDREAGRVRWAWKRGTPPLSPAQEAKLVAAGKLRADEALYQLRDADTGKAVAAHGGSVYWNDYRKRWVMIVVQSFGTSALGEVWYAEADTPAGPWVYARKVVTHDRYSFYNPAQHPFFDWKGGRFVYFEGTYAATFSGNDDPTPRYDYNQVMYRLDLDDPRLVLPAPVYDLGDGHYGFAGALKKKGEAPAFFALDRPRPGSVAVYAAGGLRTEAPAAGAKPVFHALPADLRDPPATAIPLYEFVHADGKRRTYTTDRHWHGEGFTRSEKPLCLVWRSPTRLALAE